MMVRMIARYECEVCGGTYSQLEDAKACEEQGKPTPRFKLGEYFTLRNGRRKGQKVKVIHILYSQCHNVSYQLEVQNSPDDIHWAFQASEDEVMHLLMEEV